MLEFQSKSNFAQPHMGEAISYNLIKIQENLWELANKEIPSVV